MGAIPGVNPNQFGMAESIVCSRAKDFAGTYYSTFTGEERIGEWRDKWKRGKDGEGKEGEENERK